MNIGEAAVAAGLSPRMVRHHEKIGLTPKALRRDSQYRNCSTNDVHRLRFVARARDLGFPIDETGELLALWSDQTRASADVKAENRYRSGTPCDFR
jgi:MerR family copper efflux transcriptional regulator